MAIRVSHVVIEVLYKILPQQEQPSKRYGPKVWMS